MKSIYKRFLPCIAIFTLVNAVEIQPDWWAERGAIDPSITPLNHAALNQGQLKMMALAAFGELEEFAPGGAGERLKTFLFGLPGKRDGVLEKNTAPYAGVTQGQLKNISSEFLLRLGEIGYFKMDSQSPPQPVYPWASVSSPHPNHNALANIGMVKNLFNFDLRKDADFDTQLNMTVPDGLPDWWEVLKFGQGKKYSEWTHAVNPNNLLSQTALDGILSQSKGSDLVSGSSPSIEYLDLFTEEWDQVPELEILKIMDSTISGHGQGNYHTPVVVGNETAFWVYIGPAGLDVDGNTDQTLRIVIEQKSLTENPSTSSIKRVVRSGVRYDADHAAPSVGIDRSGYIHVAGDMHHGHKPSIFGIGKNWAYYRSKNPYDITGGFKYANDSIASNVASPPPGFGATYVNFFTDRFGRLYASYRKRISGWDMNGSNMAAVAVYDEESESWSALGDDKYESIVFEKGDEVGSGKSVATRLEDGIFYCSGGDYNQYGQLIGGLPAYSDLRGIFRYQRYKQRFLFDSNGRMHVTCTMRSNATNPNLSQANDPNYHGIHILYAYSDDGGETFFRADGQEVGSLPMTVLTGITPNNDGLMTEANSGIVLSYEADNSGPYADNSQAALESFLRIDITKGIVVSFPDIRPGESGSRRRYWDKATNQWEDLPIAPEVFSGMIDNGGSFFRRTADTLHWYSKSEAAWVLVDGAGNQPQNFQGNQFRFDRQEFMRSGSLIFQRAELAGASYPDAPGEVYFATFSR